MMIKFKLLALSALFLLVSGFDPCRYRYEPVLCSVARWKRESPGGARDIRNPGNYLKDDLIFIAKSTWVSM